jgi:hypothetical protein
MQMVFEILTSADAAAAAEYPREVQTDRSDALSPPGSTHRCPVWSRQHWPEIRIGGGFRQRESGPATLTGP